MNLGRPLQEEPLIVPDEELEPAEGRPEVVPEPERLPA
jgi:hypothetical protein